MALHGEHDLPFKHDPSVVMSSSMIAAAFAFAIDINPTHVNILYQWYINQERKNVRVQPTDLKLLNVPWPNMVALDYMLVAEFRLDHLPAASNTLQGKPVQYL